MRRYYLAIGDKSYEVEIVALTPGMARVLVNGRPVEVRYQRTGRPGPLPGAGPPRPVPPAAPSPPPRPAPVPKPEAAPAPSGAGVITAPMPGVVLDLLVTEGARVTAGQTVAKLEAMKMENDIKSPVTGVVSEVRVAKGANVTVGEVLVVITPE